MTSLDPVLAKRATEMRRNPTEWEKRLWRHLSNSQLKGLKFRRQAVIAPFIVDFLCPAIGLIIEVDGDTHDLVTDKRRDDWLADRGYVILRITNSDVAHNMNGVLEKIIATAQALPPRTNWRRSPPQPLP